MTANLRDFPDDTLGSLGLVAIGPDDFLLDQFHLDPRTVLDVIAEQTSHCRRPPLSPRDLVARLARCGVPAFADEVRRSI